jgi:FlaA1/EpsC-like NDP-sugar epimerase
MDILGLIGRNNPLFLNDIGSLESDLRDVISSSGFLVIGGAGSIGQAVVTEIFKRNPKTLHVVDVSENNMVELVRSLRSSIGYGTGDFQTFALDCGSTEFSAMFSTYASKYDYVLNLSALKHVRSESDPFTLMRMLHTNVFNTIKTVRASRQQGIGKYFCVSTDKAANPVNMMGASKRIMELFMMREAQGISLSMARFANVAFSDGSLLHGFSQRILKRQPLSAPNDVRRYFVTPQESGELCLLSTIYGDNLEIFFPKLSDALHLTKFSDIAERFLAQIGYEPFECDSEQEARDKVDELQKIGKWPCYFFESDTTGEKDFEEFFTSAEKINWDRFEAIGVISNSRAYDTHALDAFEDGCYELLRDGQWTKKDLLELYHLILPDFGHLETGKYLDQRM